MINKQSIKVRSPKSQQRDKWDRRFAIGAIILIVAAWIIGNVAFAVEIPACDLSLLPGATTCRTITAGTYEGIRDEEDGSETIVGWATVANAPGYAGSVQVLVGVNPAGQITGVKVTNQTETPSFYGRIVDTKFTNSFAAMAATSPFQLGEDVDAVSRATITSRAITQAVKQGSYTLAEQRLGLEVTREQTPIVFGLPEITLIALYGAAYIGHRRNFKHKKIVRWGTMITGMVVLGFVANGPLTIAHINSLLLGFWPDWQTNLYWFLLVGGILLVVTADNKNPYCQWFCPFGAVQECLGAIGRAKYIQPQRGKNTLKWIQRSLALTAILLALLLRNPGISSYEVFGTLFAFNGVGVQWIVLIIILLMSMFVRRPWCNFLCPLDPIVDFIHAIRRWVKDLWQQIRPQIDADTPT
jgi:uncharacterized protein with FMN-binding domain